MPENIRYRFFFKGKSYLIPKDYIDNEHPGGSDEIMPYVDKDMTDAFEDADHSLNAVDMLEEWLDEEYDLGIQPDPTAVASPAQEGAKTAGPATEASPPAAAATPAVRIATPTVSTAPAATAPTTASEPSKSKLFVPVAATAAAVAVLMASATLVYVRVPKRR
ncbi:Cytochrome b5-like Heme/Steroid binding domain containing protein [Leishmania donovani]|uniref:Cytochrome_b5-like_Heme /Steroid_binding_domain_containing_protein_-_putative n=3 Tax=Leishmania donovani species complex TaxID=38574 RepID=A0A6L0XLZ1_LEIIN|nr:hypothetical protein, unknown function [Leishmania infantum JPCM5]XP_003863211.1 hypothetical protein, unknown function [Leishmania donovani]CAC9518793.1 Cytochrome_b5-like_Heme /Steroid_binding_domain_containing_protein_-_putative [Leishmania infantum]AYU81316.1 Cytochrome b5-like Heme/Steroid binding domain containing protein, putative [Leishmania donovani]TPP41498.1 Cytochrome b5-like Heme/Steroid binding domain family protein [Leishmania donovani]TPP42645.1 Cytochrome b5-like Heme/Stero|eukprot:XP_001467413.1 hypothetical protein, unknown function [Leishmania infantum JPCM5]